jgi:hypothetical protein
MRPPNEGSPPAARQGGFPGKSTNPTDADSLAVTGAILVDLTVVDPRVAYRRVSGLHMAPDGAHVELHVGHMKVDPPTIRLVRGQLPRLTITVKGEVYATGKWVRALRDGNPLSDELPLGVTA